MRAGEVEDVYALSPIQYGMLIESVLAPHAGTYVQQLSCRLHGPLDTAALGDAWQTVVRRHPILRTRFVWEGLDDPHQVVQAAVELPLAEVDWRDRPAESHSPALDELLAGDRRTGIDPARAPLLRLRLVRLGADERALVWTFHHLLLDNWTEVRVLDEVATLYRTRGDATSLRPVRSFRDYVAGVHRRDLAPAAAYWTRTLSGFAEPNRFAGDAGTPGMRRTEEGLSETIGTLTTETSTALQALGRSHRLAFHTLVQGAWALVVAGASARRDVVFGTTVRVRGAETLAAAATICGPLVNTLPVRVAVPPDATLLAWLGGLQQATVAAREHDHVSLAQIHAWSGVPGGVPLFDSFVVAQSHDVAAPFRELGPEMRVGDVRYVQQSNLPVMLTEVTGAPLRLRLTWDHRRLPARVAAELLGACIHLLERFATASDERLGRLLDGVEHRRARVLADELAPAAAAGASALRATRRRGVRLDGVYARQVEPVAGLPTFRSILTGADLASWFDAAGERVAELLRSDGAVLCRGFRVDDAEGFAQAVRVLSPVLVDYDYASTPRTPLGGQVYTATDYPADQTIPQHHEMAYARRWPRRLYFGCLEPPDVGGETPLSRSSDVLARIPTAVRDRFARRGVMYVRNYGDALDLPWERVFGTASRAGVERFCREHGIVWEWCRDGSLRTRQVCQGLATHPDTGEPIWFNQAHLFHPSALAAPVREALLSQVPVDELPRNAFHGDGGPIDAEDLTAVRLAHEAASVSFRWQRGDVLVVDNMLMAHGRRPFRGGRRIVVAMAEPYTAGEIAA